MKTLLLFIIASAILSLLLTSVDAASLRQAKQKQRQQKSGLHESSYPSPPPGVENCTLRWETQNLDHFGWRTDTFQQRWFVYDKYYKPGAQNRLFFYTGNEGDVELYVKWTGAMWSRVEEFAPAILVWSEHRFFGQSHPCPGGFEQCGDYLSMDQALQDYANLIRKIKSTYYPSTGAVVTFGGSYGSILASSMRLKYPEIVQGAIASSGPVGNMNTTYRGSSYWQVVSNTMETLKPGCKTAVFNALQTAKKWLASETQQKNLMNIMGLCSVPSEYDFGIWTRSFFDEAAMGSYPFETDYIVGTATHPAPPYPAKVMCEQMFPVSTDETTQIAQLAASIKVLANLTKDQKCFNASSVGKSVSSPRWSFLVCTAHLMNELPFYGSLGLPNDAFIPQAGFTDADYVSWCNKKFGKTPRFNHLCNHGYCADAYPESSNMVLYEGGLDPWSSGGIGRAAEGYFYNISDTQPVFICPECGHHMDLMPPNENDPASIKWIRQRQTENMWKWINDYEGLDKKKKNSDL